jgi:uncharacterized protein YqgQ
MDFEVQQHKISSLLKHGIMKEKEFLESVE